MPQNKNTITRKATSAVALSMIGSVAMAQDAAASTTDTSNWLEWLLVISAIVLVLVIWLLSQVLITLSKSILKKRKGESVLKTLVLLITSSLFASAATAQTDYIVTGMSNDKSYGGMQAIEFYSLATVVGLELIVILFLSFMVKRAFKELSGQADEELAKERKGLGLIALWNTIDKKWMTKAVPVEKEADILLDHDYDGIRELDNALPPWWKYGFYITVVIAVIYIFYFHVLEIGLDPTQEYAAEMEEGKRQEELYKSKTKDLIDENNITMADAAGIADAKALYISTCVPCHGGKGEGGVGPNLTDEYWIHGGSMNDIYKTIKLGYPEKGMQSWQAMFTPIQIQNLASFVKSLKGTNPPNGKAPQGDKYTEESKAPAATADSSAATANSPK